MRRHINNIFKEVRGYGTRTYAERVLDQAFDRISETCHILTCVVQRDDGRYVPVAILKDEDMHLIHFLGSKNICCMN